MQSLQGFAADPFMMISVGITTAALSRKPTNDVIKHSEFRRAQNQEISP